MKENNFQAIIEKTIIPSLLLTHYDIRFYVFTMSISDATNQFLLSNTDIILCIFKHFWNLSHEEYSDALNFDAYNNCFHPPSKFYKQKNLPTLFHSANNRHKDILYLARKIIKKYLADSPPPTETGATRAWAFKSIFKNSNLSSGVKMMALYALITKRPLGGSRLHDKLENSLGLHYDEIKSAANYYANQKKLDLQRFSDNLLENIFDKDQYQYGNFWEDPEDIQRAPQERFTEYCDIKQMRF